MRFSRGSRDKTLASVGFRPNDAYEGFVQEVECSEVSTIATWLLLIRSVLGLLAKGSNQRRDQNDNHHLHYRESRAGTNTSNGCVAGNFPPHFLCRSYIGGVGWPRPPILVRRHRATKSHLKTLF